MRLVSDQADPGAAPNPNSAPTAKLTAYTTPPDVPRRTTVTIEEFKGRAMSTIRSVFLAYAVEPAIAAAAFLRMAGVASWAVFRAALCRSAIASARGGYERLACVCAEMDDPIPVDSG